VIDGSVEDIVQFSPSITNLRIQLQKRVYFSGHKH
jgi:hypothetical protein